MPKRHLAKAGGSKRKLRGLPTLVTEQGEVERAERERRSAQAQRGRLGKRLARAWGLASLAIWIVASDQKPRVLAGTISVLPEMRERIQEKLRAFWDAGPRGPGFVWAPTGPALEAYSQHPAIKKAKKPGNHSTSMNF
jgi:putative DNA methylase